MLKTVFVRDPTQAEDHGDDDRAEAELEQDAPGEHQGLAGPELRERVHLGRRHRSGRGAVLDRLAALAEGWG